ncbi:MAG: Ca-activated chloride channel family protein, partial [Kiritimatiellia bacterium]
DVDTASYANVRRLLRAGDKPPPEAVRVEEFINALPYDYAEPAPGEDFAIDMEASVSPWNPQRHVVRIGVQARRADVVPVHLTLLVDVSPSMAGRNKLDLAKRVTEVICRQLGPSDTLELLAYSDSARVVTHRAPGQRLHEVSDSLHVDLGSAGTALGTGLILAYDRAQASRQEGAVSRVVLLADGDANVGANSLQSLLAIAQTGRDQGVALTTVGFGGDDLNDVVLEQLADRSDGNYHFIDSIIEARRVFEEQLRPTLQIVAQDVKLQVRWNPTAIASWRLVGYENRVVDSSAFHDDDVDAGEVGSGHQITAIYEVALRPQPSGPLGSVHIRHRAPGSARTALELRQVIGQDVVAGSLGATSDQFRLQLAALGLAERLRGSEHIQASYSALGDLTIGAMRDRYPEDLELLELIDRASRLSGGRGMASRPGFGPR